jgi:hypothetical protein
VVVTGSSGNWVITLTVAATAMALISNRVDSYDAEVKYKIGSAVKPLWAGAAILTEGVVRAI